MIYGQEYWSLYMKVYEIKSASAHILASKRCFAPVKNNTNKLETAVDTVNFTGTGSYDILLSHAVKKNYINTNQLKDSFEVLFNAVRSATRIQKENGFEILSDLLKKSGIDGLFNALAKEPPNTEIGRLANSADQKSIALAGSKEHPFLDLFSWGKRKSNKTNDIRITFYGIDKSNIEFGLNKKGGWIISQHFDNQTIIKEFYKDTGTVSKITTQQKDANPETIYFDKNGKRPFWKNFFRGGFIPQVY